MVTWINIPASDSLREEFDEAFPARDRASDGTVGDQAHAGSSSDHNPDETGATPYEDADSVNEVHARDVDADLRRAGWSMTRVLADVIVPRCRSGAETRLQNIIYNGRIISRSWGWYEWRTYSGANRHDKHAHFSFRYGSGAASVNPEARTGPWGILAAVEREQEAEDDGMADITQARFSELFTRAMHDMKIGNSGQTFAQALDQVDQTLAAAQAAASVAGAAAAAITALTTSEGVGDARVAESLARLNTSADQIKALIEGMTTSGGTSAQR